jgi:PAS domain-containing protein
MGASGSVSPGRAVFPSYIECELDQRPENSSDAGQYELSTKELIKYLEDQRQSARKMGEALTPTSPSSLTNVVKPSAVACSSDMSCPLGTLDLVRVVLGEPKFREELLEFIRADLGSEDVSFFHNFNDAVRYKVAVTGLLKEFGKEAPEEESAEGAVMKLSSEEMAARTALETQLSKHSSAVMSIIAMGCTQKFIGQKHTWTFPRNQVAEAQTTLSAATSTNSSCRLSNRSFLRQQSYGTIDPNGGSSRRTSYSRTVSGVFITGEKDQPQIAQAASNLLASSMLSGRLSRNNSARTSARTTRRAPSKRGEEMNAEPSPGSTGEQVIAEIEKGCGDLCANLAGKSWFRQLILALEDLPVSVSICSASESRPGFPLVYVNKSFERCTEYMRAEALGKMWDFQKGNNTKPAALEKIGDALKAAKPCRVDMLQYTRKGLRYRNLMSVKPIFDQTGKYRYAVCVNFDTSERGTSISKLNLASEIYRFIPEVIYES